MAEDEDIEFEKNELRLQNTGETLRQAREQKGLSIEDVAKTTRVPQRHLQSIETGDFDALPGRTYAIGFAKSYARSVGLSETSIGSQLREEMEEQGHGAYQPETSGYSPSNPTSVPPKYLAWTAAGIGALLLVGYLIWRTLFLEPSTDLATSGTQDSLVDDNTEQTTTAGAQTDTGAALSNGGTVILTATEKVWLKIYDEGDNRLFEREMAAGDKYTVPADAKGPQILTGRPDALTVTIDGKVVPPLGTAERTIKDVGISAAALLARGKPGASSADNSNDQ